MPRAPPKIATTPKKKANASKASSAKSPRKSVERPARKAKAESVKRTSEVYHPPPAPKPEPTLKKEKVARTETTTAKNSKSGKKSGPTKGGHPSYKDMIQEAITSLCKTDRGRRGASRRAILTYVMVKFTKDQAEHLVNNRLKRALRAGLDDGLFKQTSGTGVSGSFKNT